MASSKRAFSLTSGAVAAAGVALVAYVLVGLGKQPAPASHMHDLSQPAALPLFVGQQLLGAALGSAARRLQNPMQVVFADTMGFGRTAMVYTACRLDLSSLLGNEGRSTAALAAAARANEAYLFRLLRALAAAGYYQLEPGTQLWWNTALSSLLRRDHPNYACAFVSHVMEDTWMPWRQLHHVVGDAAGAYDAFKAENHGLSIWEHFRANNAQGVQFNEAMTAVDHLGEQHRPGTRRTRLLPRRRSLTAPLSGTLTRLPSTSGWYATVHDYKWGQHKRVIDVGGSLGSLLARVMDANPSVEGVVFDLPEVVRETERVWARKHPHLLSRATFVPGSFFDADTIPRAKDGDAYMMRVVLHDVSGRRRSDPSQTRAFHRRTTTVASPVDTRTQTHSPAPRPTPRCSGTMPTAPRFSATCAAPWGPPPLASRSWSRSWRTAWIPSPPAGSWTST